MTRVRYFIMRRPTGDVFQWHDTDDGKAGGTVSSVSVRGGECNHTITVKTRLEPFSPYLDALGAHFLK